MAKYTQYTKQNEDDAFLRHVYVSPSRTVAIKLEYEYEYI